MHAHIGNSPAFKECIDDVRQDENNKEFTPVRPRDGDLWLRVDPSDGAFHLDLFHRRRRRAPLLEFHLLRIRWEERERMSERTRTKSRN